MSFPVADWQFWVVTASALGSVWALVRPFLAERSEKAGACSTCSFSTGSPCHPARSATPTGDRLVVLGDRR